MKFSLQLLPKKQILKFISDENLLESCTQEVDVNGNDGQSASTSCEKDGKSAGASTLSRLKKNCKVL